MRVVLSLAVIAVFFHGVASSQVIDFEELPGGTTPGDNMIITNQYAADYGVTFELIDPPSGVTGPRIARVGPPKTAHTGPSGDSPCDGAGVNEDDMQSSYLPVKCNFLTDDGEGVSPPVGLRIIYSNPTREASGEILDIDAEDEWTITALDVDTIVIQTVVMRDMDPGTGNGIATRWSFSDIGEDIYFIDVQYTGPNDIAGLGFDNFSPSSIPANLSVSKAGTPDAAVGDTLSYLLTVANAGPGDASGVVLTDILPPGVEFLSATPSQGICEENGGLVICDLMSIQNGGSASIEIMGVLNHVFVVNSTSVLANESDPDALDNQATALTQIQCDGLLAIPGSEHMAGTTLHQNAPNPFNPRTTICFSLEKTAFVEVRVYDISGRLVRSLVENVLNAGLQQIVWDGRDSSNAAVSSGTYFYQLRVDGEVLGAKKALLLK